MLKKLLIILGILLGVLLSLTASDNDALLLLADFDNADKINNLDGIYDTWAKDPGDATQSCGMTFSEEHRMGDKGYALRIDFDVDSPNEAYNGLWMRLEGKDLSSYKTLELDIQGDKEISFTHQFVIEIKNEKQSSKFTVSGIKDEWKHFVIPLKRFSGITDWSNMTEIVFVFEDKICDIKSGRIYIDNMAFNKADFSPADLVVSDFENAQTTNNLGGAFNSWTRDPNSQTEYCQFNFVEDPEKKGNIVLQIDYRTESPADSFNGMWFKLEGIDLTQYKKLSLRVRGDVELDYARKFQMELKTKIQNEASNRPAILDMAHSMQASKVDIPVNKSWKTIEIPLTNFKQINQWQNAQELVVVFDKTYLKENASPLKGRIYIDDILFSKSDANPESQKSGLSCPHCGRQIVMGNHKRALPKFCQFCGKDLE